jgi:16S rRNA (cytidine1402-2'-O)-methyltransferase
VDNNDSKILYVVSTPIGNLKDISLRALETLKEVDFILCEDTRHTGKLLKHFEISKKLISFHGHSDDKKIETIIEKIKEVRSVALVSDAGTPGISDPAYKLTTRCTEENIKIVPIVGAAAFLGALQAAACPINQFYYLGFLPIKKGRKKLLESLKTEDKTVVFYESVHRIKKTLQELKSYLGEEKYIIIARELTKLHEEFFRGSIKEAEKHFNNPKGEFVVILPAEKRK